MKKIYAPILLALSAHAYSAPLHMSPLFSDNMVLQQGMADPLWGTGTPGQIVKVRFDGRDYQTTVLPSGKWALKVKPSKAGGPYTLQVTSGQESLEFKNVLVGEVWVCSGQSNMEMDVNGVKNGKAEIANAKFPQIRLLHVGGGWGKKEEISVNGGKWFECSPETVGGFSATAYFYARAIYKKTGVPIGLIESAVGGTPAEMWTPKDKIVEMEEYALEDGPKRRYEAALKLWKKQVDARDRGIYSDNTGYPNAQMSFLKGWDKVQVPSTWNKPDPLSFTGVIWYAKALNLPAEMLGSDLTLNLGPVIEESTVYWNGQELTPQGSKDKVTYTLPVNSLKATENKLIIRVLGYENGGFKGKPEEMQISSKSGANLALAGEWSWRRGCELYDLRRPYQENLSLGSLYDSMIAPLIPYGIRGAIWYQGESNTWRAYRYKTLLPLMIRSWREKWGQGNFPFYFMQLPIIGRVEDTLITDSNWAELRDAQRQTLSVPNTGMAVTLDFNDPDLHPSIKQDFGQRLALIPLAKLYGQNNDYEGPLYKGYKIEGKSVRIFFSNPQIGLKSRDGEALKGFVMAGGDRVFYLAKAKIEGDSVVVTCDMVKKPAAVRYAWSDWPLNNLASAAGLPASTFRTDKWKLTTQTSE